MSTNVPVSSPPPERGLPWYRREPWLVATAASIVPLLAATVAPAALHVPLVAVAALLLIGAGVLLARQGLFRDAPTRDTRS